MLGDRTVNPLIDRSRTTTSPYRSSSSRQPPPQDGTTMDGTDRISKSDRMESDDDSEEDRSGSALVGTDGNPTAYKRKIACMACRTIKLRCLLATATSAPDDPCHRCSRMSIPCVYKRKRKPLRPGQTRREDGEIVQGGGEIVKLDKEGKKAIMGRNGKKVEEDSWRQLDPHSNRSYPPSHSRDSSFDHSTLAAGSSRPFLSGQSSSRVEDAFPRPPLITGIQTSPSFVYNNVPGDRQMVDTFSNTEPRSVFSTTTFFDETLRGVDSMYHNTTYFPPPEEGPSPKFRSLDAFHLHSNHGQAFNVGGSSMSPVSRPSNATSTPGGGLGRLASISSGHSGHVPRPRTLVRMSTEGHHPRDEDMNIQDRVRDRELREREHPARQSMTLSSVLDHMRRDLSPYPGRRRRSHSPDTDDHKNKRMRWDEARRNGYGPDTSWERSRILSLAEDSGPGSRDGNVTRDSEVDDSLDDGDWNPVKLGLLKSSDVPYLFDCYFSKLNYYIALLDPVLHTPEFVKRTCPTLFISMLTVTARSFQHERYAALLKLGNSMLGQAFAQGRAEIGLIQSLSLLSVWKDGADKSNWMKISYAISIAFMLSLDAPPQRPLPEDEMEAREVLNRERTWIQIFSTDRTLHMMFGRPRMCSPETQWSIARWVKDHPQFPCYADAMLAASQGSGGLLNGMRQNRSFEPDAIRYRMVLHQLKADFALWDSTWFGEHSPAPVHPTSMVILRYYALLCDFEFAEFQRLLTPVVNPGYGMNEAIIESTVRAVDLLKYVVDSLAPAEIMAYAPDIVTVGAAKAGIFLVRHADHIESSVNLEIAHLFRQLVDICRTASHGEDTAYYQARFFSSLKRVGSVAPTRVASKFGSPKMGAKVLTNGESAPVTGAALEARLKEVMEGVPPTNGLAPAMALEGGALSGELFTLEDLLMESADWFSLDVMNQLNDTAWGGGVGTASHQVAGMQQQQAVLQPIGWDMQQQGGNAYF